MSMVDGVAHLVGEHGKVVCIDLQEVMIENLIKRAKSAGLDKQMEIRGGAVLLSKTF